MMKYLNQIKSYSSPLASKLKLIAPEILPRASVLVPMFLGPSELPWQVPLKRSAPEAKEGELWVWLTTRSTQLHSHPGEVSFPGGKRESHDQDDIQTAIRESFEEVRLTPSSFEIINVLEPSLCKQTLLVLPVLALVNSDFSPIPQTAEVSSAFPVPLRAFLKSDYHSKHDHSITAPWSHHRHWIHSFQFPIEWLSHPVYQGFMKEKFVTLFNSHPVHQFPTIWGLTAQILIHLATIAYSEKSVEFEIFSADAPTWSKVSNRFIDFHVNMAKVNVATTTATNE